MISHEYKCIFIHIPKCAGTSIESALGHHAFYEGRGMQDHRTLRDIEPRSFPVSLAANLRRLVYYRKRMLQLAGYRKDRNVKNNLIVTRDQYDSYFKFTIVRNPWDRCYSWYRNVMRDPVHLARHGLSGTIPFGDFVHRFIGCSNLRSQLRWIRNRSGRVDMDFVGRFERLQDDFAHVSDRIGLRNVRLPHKLHGGEADYLRAYDSNLRDFVGEFFSEEIRLFGYSFEAAPSANAG